MMFQILEIVSFDKKFKVSILENPDILSNNKKNLKLFIWVN